MNARRNRYGRRGRRAASAGAGEGHPKSAKGRAKTSGKGARSASHPARREHRPPAHAARPAQGAQHSAGSAAAARTASSRLHAGGTAEGIVSAHRAGYGFVRIEGLKDSVFLPPRQMRGIMHGDRVRVTLARDASERWLGEVEEVLDRGVSAFLGTLELHGRQAWVSAAERRLQLRCAVPLSELNGARSGDWVIARITRHASSAAGAQASIQKRLDPDRPVEVATESAIARFDLSCEFPAAALREAQGFGDRVDPAEAARRIDLRELPLVTIDGEDARDFDDAVYAEPRGEDFRLIVAIADVSHYVRAGSALDAAAIERGTSVYFPSRVLPMLPTALSDHLCSLAPQVDRLCLAADMIVTRRGTLAAARFYPAVMRSAARLTYTLAQAALIEGRPEARREIGGELAERLMPLVELYRILHRTRVRRGALDFDAAEAEFEIDAAEHIRTIELRARNDAHRLIEECMILANIAVARELERTHTPTLYRIHGQPEGEKLDRLVSSLRALGIEAQLPEVPAPRDFQALVRRVGNSPDRPFVESLIVRAMPQALYQPTNIGHFGLALTQYAHFTSPIRRYPDLIVHRTLKCLLDPGDGSGRCYSTDELAGQGESLSQLEKRADEADRYVSTFLKCTYLRERTGQTFLGLITTVVEFGCFVQILEVSVDGLLHLDNLRDDEYLLDESGHAWVGRRHGRRLGTGSHVRVTVMAVNPIEGLIDLGLAEEDA
ncbi:MAG TPA: ribonuclease R [Steroidobacteraceae bacterium]|nr:ribonuclease R [Steroidobacteraceae bacterium]